MSEVEEVAHIPETHILARVLKEGADDAVVTARRRDLEHILRTRTCTDAQEVLVLVEH